LLLLAYKKQQITVDDFPFIPTQKGKEQRIPKTLEHLCVLKLKILSQTYCMQMYFYTKKTSIKRKIIIYAFTFLLIKTFYKKSSCAAHSQKKRYLLDL
jgi:hypothetical protein